MQMVLLKQTWSCLSVGRKCGLSLWRSLHLQPQGPLCVKVFKLRSFQHYLLIFFLFVQEDNPVYHNDFHMLTGINHLRAEEDSKQRGILKKSLEEALLTLVKPI